MADLFDYSGYGYGGMLNSALANAALAASYGNQGYSQAPQVNTGVLDNQTQRYLGDQRLGGDVFGSQAARDASIYGGYYGAQAGLYGNLMGKEIDARTAAQLDNQKTNRLMSVLNAYGPGLMGGGGYDRFQGFQTAGGGPSLSMVYGGTQSGGGSPGASGSVQVASQRQAGPIGGGYPGQASAAMGQLIQPPISVGPDMGGTDYLGAAYSVGGSVNGPNPNIATGGGVVGIPASAYQGSGYGGISGGGGYGYGPEGPDSNPYSATGGSWGAPVKRTNTLGLPGGAPSKSNAPSPYGSTYGTVQPSSKTKKSSSSKKPTAAPGTPINKYGLPGTAGMTLGMY